MSSRLEGDGDASYGSVLEEEHTSGLRRYGAAIAGVGIALATAYFLVPATGQQNIHLIFLMAVIAIAVVIGRGPALFASFLSVVASGYFLMEPVHTFQIADSESVAALFFLIVAALITSHLASRARNEAIKARQRANETMAIYNFSRTLSQRASLDNLAGATLEGLQAMLSLDGVIVLRGKDSEIARQIPGEDVVSINAMDLAAVRESWHSASEPRPFLRVGDRLYLPLRAGNGIVGSLGVYRDWPQAPLRHSERRLLVAIADQTASAMERALLAQERDAALVTSERERLRSTLFASLSHDLKTPLASITGAITSLRQYGELYSAEERDELAGMIQSEAERLERFVANLLDMARLEAGGVAPKTEPVDPGDIVGTALERTGQVLGKHDVQLNIAPDLPMLKLDPVLFEQVMVNLLDNAGKHGRPGTAIVINARREDGGVAISVADEGPGIPSEDLPRVFEKFYRAERGDRRLAGTGLGLAICRGFVEAMGGTITIDNRAKPEHGAIFSVRFPADILAEIPQKPELTP